MKKSLLILIVDLIGSVFYSQPPALADLPDQCLLNVPTHTASIVNSNPNSGSHNTLPVYIQADKVSASYPAHVIFRGNVDIEQGDIKLTADEVQLKQCQRKHQDPRRIITATGKINYASNEIKLQGSKAWSNLNTKDTNIYQGNYQMLNQQGRGNADTMKQRKDNRYTVLENGSFTSCLPGDKRWSLVGSEVIYDREEQVAEIWNAQFKISKVPVLYSPYLQVPVGSKRRFGFLIPNAKYSSNNGFEFSAPYYINLLPNYDITLIPNYMSKHGTQIQTEFHYLTNLGEGLVEFNWLPKDYVYNSNDRARKGGSNQWLLYWHHDGFINQAYHFDVDYNRVSVYNYFDSLDSKCNSTTEAYFTQKFRFSYTNKNWDTALLYKQFQIFDANKNNSNAYRATPYFYLTYYKNNIGPLNFKVFGQAAKFTNVNDDYPETIRLHIEPMLNLSLVNYWGSMNTEAKIMATHYQQKNIDCYNDNTNTYYLLRKSVSRIVPQFKTDGKIMFKHDDYAPHYTQTWELQLQYLYIPYHNQNDIGIYDSTILQTDYSSLFRDRTYSGLDRISSANQLAGRVTARIYNDQYMERFNASVGHIYYLLRPCIDGLTDIWDNDDDNTGNMICAGDSYWRISNHWGVRGNLQYDFHLNSMALGSAVLEYRRDENNILQLNYRYANSRYIEQILSDANRHDYQRSISQVGVTCSLPLVDHWSLVGAYYYDIQANQAADQLVSLQYNTSCWTINIGYERKIASWDDINSSSQYNNKVLFNIKLSGLSSNSSLDTDKILGSGILPYQQMF